MKVLNHEVNRVVLTQGHRRVTAVETTNDTVNVVAEFWKQNEWHLEVVDNIKPEELEKFLNIYL